MCDNNHVHLSPTPCAYAIHTHGIIRCCFLVVHVTHVCASLMVCVCVSVCDGMLDVVQRSVMVMVWYRQTTPVFVHVMV